MINTCKLYIKTCRRMQNLLLELRGPAEQYMNSGLGADSKR